MTLEEYKTLRAQGKSPDEIASLQKSGKLTFGKALGNTAEGVTDFIGAKGISDLVGSQIAKLGLAVSGNMDAANRVAQPSIKEVAGSAIQTGSLLIPSAGVATGAAKLAKPLFGKVAGVVGKAVAGGAVGYGLDVGKNLQEGKSAPLQPGAATAVGIILPALSSIVGLGVKTAPRKLEEINLRLTPVEKQNLAKNGKDIASFLSKKAIVGTPPQRLAKIETLYDDMENLVQEKVKLSGVEYPRLGLMRELDELPKQFIDDPELHTEAVNNIAKFKELLTNQHGKTISAETVNEFKRSLFKRAFSINSSDVLNETRLAMGGFFKGLLDDSIKGLEPLNKEYGYLIASRRALSKAATRSEIGLVGKIAGTTAGTVIGGSVGGAAGAAAGAVAGPLVGKTVFGTLPRSAVGAGLQKLSTAIERLPSKGGEVSLKSVLALIESLR